MRITLSLLAAAALLPTAAIRSGVGGGEPRRDGDNRGEPEFDWIVPGQSVNKTLASLARSQGLNPRDFDNPYLFSDDTPVNRINAGKRTYAVAVQTVERQKIPGESAQQIILLTTTGRILDRIRCEINSRYGVVEAEIFPKPVPDGSRLMIRFVGRQWTRGDPRVSSSGDQIITHGGKFWKVRPGLTPHTAWNEKCLCRIGIGDDNLIVVFPKLDNLDDPEIRKAKALRVIYNPAGPDSQTGVPKQVDVVDPEQVSELLAKIKIKGEDQGDFGFASAHPAVEFIMRDGTTTRWRLERSTLVGIVESKWMFGKWDPPLPTTGGTLHLTSTALFDEIEKLVSKAEGHPVDLLGEKRGQKDQGKADRSKN